MTNVSTSTYGSDYISHAYYNILTYDCEAWCLDDETRKAINGANASMVSVITEKTQHQQVSKNSGR